MWQPILWALLTGGVTGGAWVGIVLLRRRHRDICRQRELIDAAHAQLDVTVDTQARLLEAEERLDFAERALLRQREITARDAADRSRDSERL